MRRILDLKVRLDIQHETYGLIKRNILWIAEKLNVISDLEAKCKDAIVKDDDYKQKLKDVWELYLS